ncbi:MAG: MBL fold metallo-hydrolase, partial [Trebonia sp.]
MDRPVVHTYRAAESGLYVNSYLVEGESGVVVVDTNLLVSDIEALRARLRALKKPLLAIMVTHAHPDHFNGVLGLVQDKEVPVYATAGVGRIIEEIAHAKRAQWSPVYGTEWPAETYYPNSLGVIPILGARTAKQLADNLTCLDVNLPPEALTRLDQASHIARG